MPRAVSQTFRPASAAAAFPLRRWIRVPWDYLAMAGGLLFWGVAGLLIAVISLPLLVILPCAVARRFGRSLLHRTFKFFVFYLKATDLVHADLSSLDSLKHQKKPVIIAPNHTSLWDAVFVISKLPEPICIMKKTILANPVLGGGARLAGYIPNGASSGMVRSASNALSQSGQLLLFPEGTRTRRHARWINPLKGGCALISRQAGVPVRPVFIRSNTRFTEKGWPLWKRPDFPIKLSIELGDEISPEEGESAHEFTHRLEELYERNLSRAHKLRRQVVRDGG